MRITMPECAEKTGFLRLIFVGVAGVPESRILSSTPTNRLWDRDLRCVEEGHYCELF